MSAEEFTGDISRNYAASPYTSNDEHDPSEDIHVPSPKRIRLESESEEHDSEYEREIESYNEQLHAVMSKNVELHNVQNKAQALLRKINNQNQDLLEALLATEPDLSNLPMEAAPAATLTKEQEAEFEMHTSW